MIILKPNKVGINDSLGVFENNLLPLLLNFEKLTTGIATSSVQ